jgi:hypothetical protein
MEYSLHMWLFIPSPQAGGAMSVAEIISQRMPEATEAQSGPASIVWKRGATLVAACAVLVFAVSYLWGRAWAPALMASVYAASAVTALLWPAVGLLLLLMALPFEKTFHARLDPAHWVWFPTRFHLVDLLAGVLLLWLAERVVTRSSRVRWRWYDVVYALWVAVLVVAAVRGVLAGHPEALKKSRAVLWLLVYFPAREIICAADPRRCFRALLVGGIVLCLLGGVLAYALQADIGRPGDILLPRLQRAVNIAPLMLLPMLGWAGLALEGSRRWRRVAALAVVLGAAALAMANSRSSFLAVGCAWVVLAHVSMRAMSRRKSARAICLASALFVVGFCGVHAIDIAASWAEARPAATMPTAQPEPVTELNPTPRPRRATPRSPSLEGLAKTMRVTPQQITQGESWVNRRRETQTVLAEVQEQPIAGGGIGAIVTYQGLSCDGAPKVISRAYVHSYYHQMLHATGVPGLFGFLAVLVSLGWRAWSRVSSGRMVGAIEITALLSFTALLPAWYFTAMIMDRAAAWPAVVLAGVATQWPAAAARRGTITHSSRAARTAPQQRVRASGGGVV